MTTINLYNPDILPFGELSNNAQIDFQICNKNNVCEKWNSITQFIYTNMIKNPVYQQNIKEITNYNKIHEEYIKYTQKSEEAIIAESLDEALRVKFQNPDVLNILLKTGKSEIVYISENDFLGNGTNNKGSNILGKYLMQIRDEILNSKDVEENKKSLERQCYEAYLIYNMLKQEITENGNDLSKYLFEDMTKIYEISIINNFNDIMNIYLQNKSENEKKIIIENIQNSMNDNDKKMIFLNFIQKNHEMRLLYEVAIRKPFVLILDLRKKYLENVKKNLDKIKINITFNIYLDFIIETKFPNFKKEDYDKIKIQQFQHLSAEKLEEMKIKVYNSIKLFSSVLYAKVEKVLSTLKIPSEEEILFAQSFNLNDFIFLEKESEIKEENEKNKENKGNNKKEEDNKQIKKDKKQKVIKIFQGIPSPYYIDNLNLIKSRSYQILSPIYYSGMLKIKNNLYPTVTHYIIANLFASLKSIGNLEESYKYLLKDPSRQVWYDNIPFNYIDYKTLFTSYYTLSLSDEGNNLKFYAEVSLKNKFEDKKLQKLLLQTGDKIIIWKDTNDNVLGCGKNNKGYNFVGKYLMKLRSELSLKNDMEYIETNETFETNKGYNKFKYYDEINVYENEYIDEIIE